MALLISANVIRSFDRYPFILLSLTCSLQEAKAASLILLAQIWQSERDRVNAISKAEHRGHCSARMREGPRRPDRGDDGRYPPGRAPTYAQRESWGTSGRVPPPIDRCAKCGAPNPDRDNRSGKRFTGDWGGRGRRP